MIKIIAIALLVTGCQKKDPLYCGLHSNDPICMSDGGMADAPTDAPPGFFTIGGTVLGDFTGKGLVLENNAGDDLMVTAAGTFQFTTAIEMGMPYAVTASSQPTMPSQSCTVTNGNGMATGNVTDVTISCSTMPFLIGGNVFGLQTGQSVTLKLNGGNETAPIVGLGTAAAQPFMFTAPILSGATYGVTIGAGPAMQTCTVFSGDGTVGSADVGGVVVNCSLNTFILSGEISNLNGTVALSDGTTAMSLSQPGSFSFAPLASNAAYDVTVTTQPTYPPAAQTCTVMNGGPSNITMNIMNVAVDCSTNKYTIGGTMTALNGTVVLLDNGADAKTLSNNNPFTFATSIASGSTYAVSVLTQPANQYCTVSGPSGTVANANVTSVSVACDSGIRCGGASTFCDPSTQSCCGPEGAQKCITHGASCNGSLPIVMPCDSAADCTVAGSPGSCCAIESGSPKAVSSITCTTSCTGANDFVLCDPNVADACPGKTCKAFADLPNYFACQ